MSPIRVCFFMFLVFAIATQFAVYGLPNIIKKSPQQDLDLSVISSEKERAFRMAEDKHKKIESCLGNKEGQHTHLPEGDLKKLKACLDIIQEFINILKGVPSPADLM